MADEEEDRAVRYNWEPDDIQFLPAEDAAKVKPGPADLAPLVDHSHITGGEKKNA
jgi:hypothetical protein